MEEEQLSQIQQPDQPRRNNKRLIIIITIIIVVALFTIFGLIYWFNHSQTKSDDTSNVTITTKPRTKDLSDNGFGNGQRVSPTQDEQQ